MADAAASTGASHEARARFLAARHFPALDGMRTFAVLAVVWHHASRTHAPGSMGLGYGAVALFFAISGFLITTLLLREQDAAGTISLPRFYVRRTLRIFPLYFAAVGVYTVLVLLFERDTEAGRGFLSNLPYFLTYSSNWFVDLGDGGRVIFYFAWSLATEEQFYLAWPWVVRFAPRWWAAPAFMGGMVVASSASRWAVAAGLLAPSLPLRMLGSVAAPICLGCIAAYALHREGGFRRAWLVAGGRWSAPVALVLAIVGIQTAGVPEIAVHIAMTWLVVSVSIRPDHGLRWLFANRVACYVGGVTYGMYLLHMLALNTVERVVGPSAPLVLRVTLTAVLATGVAILSYRYFEKRFLDLKDRFGAGRTRVPAQAAIAAG